MAGNSRFLRGGSWLPLPRFCRSAEHDRTNSRYRSGAMGFRVVRVPGTPQKKRNKRTTRNVK
jgi:formylglycine-generating enzyme required for sulfatase activity